MPAFAPTFVPKQSSIAQPPMSGLKQPAMSPTFKLGKVTPTEFGELGQLRVPVAKSLITPLHAAPMLPRERAPRLESMPTVHIARHEHLWR